MNLFLIKRRSDGCAGGSIWINSSQSRRAIARGALPSERQFLANTFMYNFLINFAEKMYSPPSDSYDFPAGISLLPLHRAFSQCCDCLVIMLIRSHDARRQSQVHHGRRVQLANFRQSVTTFFCYLRVNTSDSVPRDGNF